MPKITMYSKTPCKPCSELKMWFKMKNIEYEEVKLDDHIQKLSDMGFMAAPVVDIDGTFVAGSNISNVREVIERQGGSNVKSNMAYA